MYGNYVYLTGEGYGVEKIISDKNLPEGLTTLALEMARGYYKKVKIVPSDAALGDVPMNFRPAEKSHLVFAILSDKHPSRKEQRKGKKILRPPLFIQGVDASSGRNFREIPLERAR